MAENPPVVHIGENSPEQVAFKLMDRILAYDKAPAPDGASVRKHVLNLYDECLSAVNGKRWESRPRE